MTIKSRIIELAGQGLAKIEIERKMFAEGYNGEDKPLIRYAYIFVILKDNNITVPKAKKVKKEHKEDVVIDLDNEIIIPEEDILIIPKEHLDMLDNI